ncbi:Uroporphyrin-III C-methyltransferase [Methyloversatilis universalis FAM5]|jgi:uroporphyrin-3 C-methyltransferase|uniref:Uroporphyrin-III C-methyltransferase n=1 Tax=Methyloversatilis universalis (strain ATCC BAA-1314 / DSM 25237 / JCM 13912 / CCUG 52030 / FAM5) TaxID=1000565 RepID=F5RHP7_METUF|nr:uroporphyrinogen-III C-methyltransferase [Methyloversatilis universalis]EGK69879.1 Uroporphyrin-III C-methyltransferase [Methyloversatilis universalis FAM5]
MSEQIPTPTPAATPAVTPVPPAKREGVVPLWALGLAVLLLVALGVASFFMLTRMRTLEAELHRRVEVVGEQAAQARDASEQEAAGIATYGNRLGSQEVQLAELRARIEAYEYLADDLVRSYDERVLAEVEHALVLGQQQLQLAGDAKLALSALSTAEARLARVDTGRFLPLRRAMANDMERLRRAPMADLSGQALRIDTLLGSIDSLPLAFDRSPSRAGSPAPAKVAAAAEPTLVERLAEEVWAEVRQLVRIERLDRPDPALLSPEHSFFLRENLKLRLINARIALLQRNGAVWREDMRLAREWVERYFDTRARQTDNALATLRQLASVDPGEGLPGLNESMSALAQLKAQRQRPTVQREEKR